MQYSAIGKRIEKAINLKSMFASKLQPIPK